MTPTRLLMSASAVALGVLGSSCLFAPDVVLGQFGLVASGAAMLIVQVTGTLYLGFAALNWMWRGNLIGGIYARPVAIGNLLHFMAASLTMIKVVWRGPEIQIVWWLAVLYSILSVSFAIVLFRHPLRSAAGDESNQ